MISKKNLPPVKDIIVIVFIFIMAFLPRVISLGTTVTTDELLWLNRAPNFINALLTFNLAGTYQAVHPGVITMWLSGIFLQLFYNTGMSFSTKELIASFPIALTTSLGVVCMYFLLKKIFGTNIAILGALLIALDPFYIANSRVVHLDAIVTTFMVLAALSLLVFLKYQDKRYYLYLTGLFTGLALLEKTPSLFLIPYTILIVVLWYILENGASWKSLKAIDLKATAIKTAKIVGIILIIAIVLFVILFPAMWVNPVNVTSLVLHGAENATDTPHGSGFYMGQVSDGSYGPSYYFTILVMRSTPIALLFSIICVIVLAANILRKKFTSINKNTLFILLFIVFFFLQMTIGQKKFDRYLLPAFPMMDIIAAIGICYIAESLFRFIQNKNSGRSLKNA